MSIANLESCDFDNLKDLGGVLCINVLFRRQTAPFAARTEAPLQTFPFEAAVPTRFFYLPSRKFSANYGYSEGFSNFTHDDAPFKKKVSSPSFVDHYIIPRKL